MDNQILYIMYIIPDYVHIPEKKYVCRGDSKLCTKYNRERVRVVVYYIL